MWEDPMPGRDKDGKPHTGNVVNIATKEDCINTMRKQYPYETEDKKLLEEFITVHWAQEIEYPDLKRKPEPEKELRKCCRVCGVTFQENVEEGTDLICAVCAFGL